MMLPLISTFEVPFIILGTFLQRNGMDPRKMILIAGGVGCFGVYLSSIIKNFYGFALCYCGAVAFANGLTYSVPL